MRYLVQLDPAKVSRFIQLLQGGCALTEALPKSIGGTEVCGGLWRFYSESWPKGGVRHWNQGSLWRTHWEGSLPAGAFAFGEDVFGNQLIVTPGSDRVLSWNHENGECTDLLVDPARLLGVALDSGIDWMDSYADGSLIVARRFGPVPMESHLHWTTPLVLGGAVLDSNLSLVAREAHLIGHAKLWSQVRGLPPGTEIRLG